MSKLVMCYRNPARKFYYLISLGILYEFQFFVTFKFLRVFYLRIFTSLTIFFGTISLNGKFTFLLFIFSPFLSFQAIWLYCTYLFLCDSICKTYLKYDADCSRCIHQVDRNLLSFWIMFFHIIKTILEAWNRAYEFRSMFCFRKINHWQRFYKFSCL